MTTNVKVQSFNHPAKVLTIDNGNQTDERVLKPEDGEVTFYATTTREIRIIDMDYGYEADKPFDGEEQKADTAE